MCLKCEPFASLFFLLPPGLVDWEITPMEVPGKGGAVTLVKEVR